VISLQGQAQARLIESALIRAVPPEEWAARDLRCGDAADFQGSERDVVFLSMVAAPEPGQRLGAATQEMNVQRYNVAVSRAKDQLWVFHSIGLDQLPNSQDMRHQLLDYCLGVRGRRDTDIEAAVAVPDDYRVDPFDSLFEQRVYNRLADRGYTVIPQYDAIGYRIDLVVVGSKTRLAVECDGDAWHGPEVYERDLARQRDLERCGWQFFRIRESAFYVDQHAALQELWTTLQDLEIRPAGWVESDVFDDADEDAVEGAETVSDAIGLVEPVARVDDGNLVDTVAGPLLTEDHDELLVGSAGPGPTGELPSVAERLGTEAILHDASPAGLGETSGSSLREYIAYDGNQKPAIEASQRELAAALVEIIRVEGPVLGSRLHSAYVQASGGRRVGRNIAHVLNGALSYALRQGMVIADNPLGRSGFRPRTFRLDDQDEVIVRDLGPRTLEEVPPLELAALLRDAAENVGWGSDEFLFHEVLQRLGRSRLTTLAIQTLTDVLPFAKRSEE
jgi:very-short-patch-repair endonuclease